MRYILIATLICSRINLLAQNINIDNSNFFYQIAPIYEFKQSIVSLTFDDGSVNQFKIALPILKEKRIPATFYVVTNWMDSTIRSAILYYISNNYEIGSHTVSHPDLVKIGNTEANKEIVNSKSFLQNNFGINAGLTMSYPGGIYNSSVEQLVKKYYLAARSTNIGYNSLYTMDRYALRTQVFNKSTKIGEANSWVNKAIKYHSWLVEMLHGIDNVGYSPINDKVLAEHLDYINSVEKSIWCSTVSNVIKYLDESENADVRCENCNDTVYNIRINDFMDDSIYNQPLSIRIKVPNNWDSIWISNTAKIRTECFNNNKFVIFNALPNNQLITIIPISISVPEKETGVKFVYMSANPFLNNIRLSLEVLNQQDIDIELSDINGRLLINQKEKNAIGVINIFFDASGLNSGLYLLRIRCNGSVCLNKKLLKIVSS